MCDMSQISLRRNATTNFINSTRKSILESTRKGMSSGDSFLQMTRGRVRSLLQHTSSPTRPNEAKSDADELSKIRGRLQMTRLPRSDTKLENVTVGTPPREIPAKTTMSIEEATANQNEHNHPPPLPPQSTPLKTARMARPKMSGMATQLGFFVGAPEGSCGLSEVYKASNEAANILVEEIIAEEDAAYSINMTVEEIMKLYQD